MRALLVFTAFLLTAASCEKKELVQNDKMASECAEKLVAKLSTEPVRNPPATVWEWLADGQTYFYVPADCCDQFNELYNSNCEVICHPDGGLTGMGDGKCPEFKEVESSFYWADGRSRCEEPTWLPGVIQYYDQQAGGPVPVWIVRYFYNGNYVFLVDECHGCLDAPQLVLNCERDTICQFGGLAGLNTCPNFFDEATDSILVYEKQ